MGSQERDLRIQTENTINKRLKRSRFWQRVAVGAGITAGIAVGAQDGNGNSLIPSEASLTIVAAASVGGLANRIVTRRACSRAVVNYEQAVTSEPAARYLQTVLTLDNDDFVESKKIDTLAVDHVGISEGVLSFLSPYAGWAGGLMAAHGMTSKHVSELGVQVPVTALGGTIAAAGVVFHIIDHQLHRGLAENYRRQLDNIDGGLIFEADDPQSDN